MRNYIENKIFNNHLLYIEPPSLYNITYTSDGNGTVTGPLSAYGGDIVTLTSTPNQYYTPNGYDVTGGIINGNNLTVNDDCIVYGKYALQSSALLYSYNHEVTGYSIRIPFSVSVPTAFPYVAVRFDWQAYGGGYWSYYRNVCDIEVIGHYNYQPNLQKVCQPLNNSSAMNEATLYTANASTNIAANNTDEGTYTTINYAWHNNTTGFSAAVAGIWRYRDSRSNNISALKNILCLNDQYENRRRFWCNHVRIACFNNAEDCLKTTW